MQARHKKEWAVVYEGAQLCNRGEADFWDYFSGIEKQDLTLDEAHTLADELNDKSNGDVQYFVAHESSNDVQKHY